MQKLHPPLPEAPNSTTLMDQRPDSQQLDNSKRRIAARPHERGRIGVVVIGRNEGDRLRRCLRSLEDQAEKVVYVDSGSTDGSIEFARSLGVHVLDLDMTKPFTMARARNAGWQYLAAQCESVEFVQFVDGDCEVAKGWVDAAVETISQDERTVAVCGRRRERLPDHSIYNTLADIEWDHAPGQVKACGGDAMMRLQALQDVQGFNDLMIAGEEAELCVRMRERGGVVRRIDVDMTRHDAAMTHFSQWWKRMVRGGHAFAEGAMMHGSPPERHNMRPLLSVVIYGGVLPVLILTAIAAGIASYPMGWTIAGVLLVSYPLLIMRIYIHRRRRSNGVRESLLYAIFCVVGKFAELTGALLFWLNRLRGRRTQLLEYKQDLRTDE